MIPTTAADWTAYEPERDIDSCCRWAECQIFTAATKALWGRVSSVEPEWFGQWCDRILWEGLLTVITANDGVYEPQHMREWLTHQEPDEAESLLETLADYGNLTLRIHSLAQAVGTLERAGQRRMLKRWATELIDACNSAEPINDIRDLVRQALATMALAAEGGAV